MIHAGTYGNGRKALREALSTRQPFKTSGALRGDNFDKPFVSYSDLGRLDREEADAFMLDHAAGDITYVVWSYGTPIAWVHKDGSVYRVQQRFSPTTSKHQGMLHMLNA